ncbi:MAG: hypothetical protein ACE5LU_16985 [Anaerolineae bacterium]
MAFGQRVSHITKQKTGPDDPELLEVLQEALQQATPDDLIAVADELAVRHERFVALLGQSSNVRSLNTGFQSAIREGIPTIRRGVLEDYLMQHDVTPLVDQLLHGEGPPATRIATFAAGLAGLDPRLRLELASGLLHYTFPEDHWLWTRWLWDETTHTGILPLLAGSVHNLVASDVAEGYVKVGSVTAMSMRFAEGTGLLTQDLMDHPRRRPFAADAFLACAYSIYLYGITSWRLSREFNRLLPTLPNMMRRLLGLPKRVET